jgi:hypothetical protein
LTLKKLSNTILESAAQEGARVAMQKAIQKGKKWISCHEEENMYLTWYNIDEDHARVYELRTDTGEDPNSNKSSCLIVRVIIDYYTGQILHDIEVYLPPINDIRTIFRVNEEPRLDENIIGKRTPFSPPTK